MGKALPAQYESCYKDGQVEVKVFTTEATYEGRKVPFREYKIERRYQDKDGEWKASNIFSFRDLENLSNILDAIRARKRGSI